MASVKTWTEEKIKTHFLWGDNERWLQQPTKCLSVFDHFVGLAFKGLAKGSLFVTFSGFLSFFFYIDVLLLEFKVVYSVLIILPYVA